MATRLGLALLLIATTPAAGQLATPSSTSDPCPLLCTQGRETALTPEDAKIYRTCVASRRCPEAPHGPFASPPDLGVGDSFVRQNREYLGIGKMLRDHDFFR